MSWDSNHSASEKLATDAQLATAAGEASRAQELYHRAAEQEVAALAELDKSKHRTRGITAVSATALWYKARDYSAAELLAHRALAEGDLPPFAQLQLRNLLQAVWTAGAAEKAGVKFVTGDVLVSVKGGNVIHGGAPLDLIVQKVEGIQSVLFRTVEMLLNRPFRKRGGPPPDLQSMFRPWLFQAPAGSYQFAVRMQEPEQGQLFESDRPKVESVTATFFSILRATAGDAEKELVAVVSDAEYRAAFVSLSRNLAPTGRTFESLEISEAGAPAKSPITLRSETRNELNATIRRMRPARVATETGEASEVGGILRAVHLDQDWLEIATSGPDAPHVKIDEAGDALDDVVGPMVNRKVIVSTMRRGGKYLYRDIQLDE